MYGDNMLVYAVANSGESFIVSVVKPQAMDSARLDDKNGINLAYFECRNGTIIPSSKVILENGF